MSQLKMFYTTCMINSVLEDSSLWMIGLDSLPKLLVSIFFKVHKIEPEIIPIDHLSAYWQKTEHVDIQYWRYEQSKFKL